jgi:hypothetical protein
MWSKRRKIKKFLYTVNDNGRKVKAPLDSRTTELQQEHFHLPIVHNEPEQCIGFELPGKTTTLPKYCSRSTITHLKWNLGE